MTWVLTYWVISVIGVLGFTILEYRRGYELHLGVVLIGLIISPVFVIICVFMEFSERYPQWYIIKRKIK